MPIQITSLSEKSVKNRLPNNNKGEKTDLKYIICRIFRRLPNQDPGPLARRPRYRGAVGRGEEVDLVGCEAGNPVRREKGVVGVL